MPHGIVLAGSGFTGGITSGSEPDRGLGSALGRCSVPGVWQSGWGYPVPTF